MFRSLAVSSKALAALSRKHGVSAPMIVRCTSTAPAAANPNPMTPVTIDMAKKMPKNYRFFSNDIIITLSRSGDQDAREERLIRDIMAVDNVTWEAAEKVLQQMATSNRRGMSAVTLPYKLGIATAVIAGFGNV
jgi:hypothetical protein